MISLISYHYINKYTSAIVYNMFMNHKYTLNVTHCLANLHSETRLQNTTATMLQQFWLIDKKLLVIECQFTLNNIVLNYYKHFTTLFFLKQQLSPITHDIGRSTHFKLVYLPNILLWNHRIFCGNAGLAAYIEALLRIALLMVYRFV